MPGFMSTPRAMQRQGALKLLQVCFLSLNKKARVLFDYGAMYSFIAVMYVHCLDRHVKSIGQT